MTINVHDPPVCRSTGRTYPCRSRSTSTTSVMDSGRSSAEIAVRSPALCLPALPPVAGPPSEAGAWDLYTLYPRSACGIGCFSRADVQVSCRHIIWGVHWFTSLWSSVCSPSIARFALFRPLTFHETSVHMEASGPSVDHSLGGGVVPSAVGAGGAGSASATVSILLLVLVAATLGKCWSIVLVTSVGRCLRLPRGGFLAGDTYVSPMCGGRDPASGRMSAAPTTYGGGGGSSTSLSESSSRLVPTHSRPSIALLVLLAISGACSPASSPARFAPDVPPLEGPASALLFPAWRLLLAWVVRCSVVSGVWSDLRFPFLMHFLLSSLVTASGTVLRALLLRFVFSRVTGATATALTSSSSSSLLDMTNARLLFARGRSCGSVACSTGGSLGSMRMLSGAGSRPPHGVASSD